MATDTGDDRQGERDEAERLKQALKVAPRGAFALAGASLLLLIVAWFLIYFLVFVPRGVVG